mgnify:CR=1 FL=1
MPVLTEQFREVIDRLSNSIDSAKSAQSLGLPFKSQKNFIIELSNWTKEQDWWKFLSKDQIEEYNYWIQKAKITIGL